MTKSPEQLYLADDMQPPPDPIRTPEMDERVHAWVRRMATRPNVPRAVTRDRSVR